VKISCLYPTARPDVASTVLKLWLDRADKPEELEIIMSVEPTWGFPPNYQCPPAKVLFNDKPPCLVNNINNAAKAATGDLLISIYDDMVPPEHWDTELIALVKDPSAEYVIHVNDGAPSNVHLMTLQVGSMARYKRLGYFLYPEYTAMYSDSEWGEHARQDRCVIEGRHLLFKHLHPFLGYGELDAVYRHENSRESLELGERVYTRRAHYGFFPPPEGLC
jgi:hypothetical protein